MALPATSDEPLTVPTRRGQHVLATAVKVLVSVGLLAVLFSRTDAPRLWSYIARASFPWLVCAVSLYLVMVLISSWRWGLLLTAQQIDLPQRTLVGSYLVATFFNNFLPSNIGGDVVRIRDSAPAAGSRTLATTVILIDRGIGLLGLVFVAAVGATAAAGHAQGATMPVGPSWLWAGLLLAAMVSVPALVAPEGVGRMLQPLCVFHPEWVGERIARVTGALSRFRERPTALVGCFLGAIAVQAVLVGFYVAITRSMNIVIAPWHLAVIVPVSFIVQMLPVSVNGFGVREATFSFYFTRLGLPLDSALVVSLVGTGLIMLFSLSGAAVYTARRSRPTRQTEKVFPSHGRQT